MRPANQHHEPGTRAQRIAPGIFFTLVLTAAAPVGKASDFKPPAGGFHVGEFTPGACVYVCEALSSMCKDAYINNKNGDCWLVLDRRNTAFTSLNRSCPLRDSYRFTAEMVGGSWRLTCAPIPAASGGKSKPAPGSGTLDKLPDIKPF